MEKGTKDKLERPSKVHFTVKGSEEDGYSVTHHEAVGPKESLSFEHEPSQESHFSAGREKDVVMHIKKHLKLGKVDGGPDSARQMSGSKRDEGEQESKGESVGLQKGKAGYKASGGKAGY